MSLHRPTPRVLASAAPVEPESVTAAVQPLLEHVLTDRVVETERVARAWDVYEMPEVRNAVRQYANAFSSAKLVLGKRDVLWEDPKPVTTDSSPAEAKALELLESFAGGPTGQQELLDRMGTYFTVPGDMALVGAYDPLRMADSQFAKWDVWSTTEIRWNGRAIQLRTSAQEDIWQVQPDYVKHLRVWNRHPRRGWLSDSPVLSCLEVLELIGLYDARLASEAVSRLMGAGVWMIPQGMSLPTVRGDTGTVTDFMQLMKQIASIAVKDGRSAAARIPIMVEAAADDIEAAAKGLIDFATDFSDKIASLQQAAIHRWAMGADLPAETMLGLSHATHWNATLISEEKNQTFVIPSLRRAVGNITIGWLKPALAQFGHDAAASRGLELWFDPSGIKTRVDLAEEVQWASDRFMVPPSAAKYLTGLGQTADPTNDELKRMMLLHMAQMKPEYVPQVLEELGIKLNTEFKFSTGNLDDAVAQVAQDAAAKKNGTATAQSPAGSNGNGRPGPQQAQEKSAPPASPGRAATVSTTRS